MCPDIFYYFIVHSFSQGLQILLSYDSCLNVAPRHVPLIVPVLQTKRRL